jgi:hypothetical protein
MKKCINKKCSKYAESHDNNCMVYFPEEMYACSRKILQDTEKVEPVEEVCIWEKTYDKVGHRFHYNLKCSRGLKLSETMYGKIWASFTYCPYCGKPIKIKE